MAQDYEDDRGERSRAGQALQGVCKDCGLATLNNDLNPAFDVDMEEGLYPVCLQCGSAHVDLL